MVPLWALSLPDVDPLPLPAPAWVFRGLLLLTFFLHLIPMNLVLGGSLIALATRLAGGHRDARAQRALTLFSTALPTLMAATITFGVAPLLFLQVLYGRAFFASAVLMAWPWIAVIPLLLCGYYAAYRSAYRAARPGIVLPLLITATIVAVSVIYSNNMSLMLRVDRFAALSGGGVPGWHVNLDDPTLAPRYLHVVCGAMAVAAGGLCAAGLLWMRKDRELGQWAVRRGSAWVAAATLFNLVVGFWWVLALPRDVLLRFMGRDPAAAVALTVGVVAGMVVLAAFALAWRGARPAPAVGAGIAALVLTLVAMVLTRDQVRESTLILVGLEPNAWVQTQWLPLGIFLLLLVGAAATIAWMVGVLVNSPRAD